MDLQSELREVWDAYSAAYQKGDASGCAAVFSPDALLTSPYAPAARGRRAIEALHEDWTSDGAQTKRLEIVDFGGTGDIAWCLAKFSEGAQADEGISLNVIERLDGRWFIKMCSLNEGGLPDS